MNETCPHLDSFSNHLQSLPIDLQQSDFFCTIVTELASLIEDTVGLKQAEGFITTVGLRMGKTIAKKYSGHAPGPGADLEALAAVLIDLKRRIHGDFYVIDIAQSHILLGNSRCPFGEGVTGRTSLCMMTTNVFGRIAADASGYARVSVMESIAAGAEHCRVLIDLSMDTPPEFTTEVSLHSGEFFAT